MEELFWRLGKRRCPRGHSLFGDDVLLRQRRARHPGHLHAMGDLREVQAQVHAADGHPGASLRGARHRQDLEGSTTRVKLREGKGAGSPGSPVPGWERSPCCAHRVPHPTTGTSCRSHRGHPGEADKAKTPLFFPQRGHRGSLSLELGQRHSADRINPAPFSWTTRQTAGNLPEAARCFAEPC